MPGMSSPPLQTVSYLCQLMQSHSYVQTVLRIPRVLVGALEVFAGGFDLKLGYEINYWGGLADRLVFLDDTHEAMFSHETEDILMDGFFVRLSRDY